jgi:2'-5' RNA ligase
VTQGAGGSTARVFVALPLPEPLGRALAAAVRPVLTPPGAERPRLRFPRPESLHLTLHFLGDVAEERVPDLLAALDEHLDGAAAPGLELDHTGGFPSLAKAHVLWAGVRETSEPVGRLDELRARTLDAVDAAGFPVTAERARPFRPHVTVARVGRGRSRGDLRERLAAFGELRPGFAFRPDRAELLESVRADGPQRYVPRGGVALATNPGA